MWSSATHCGSKVAEVNCFHRGTGLQRLGTWWNRYQGISVQHAEQTAATLRTGRRSPISALALVQIMIPSQGNPVVFRPR